jgi:hypothetical protein
LLNRHRLSIAQLEIVLTDELDIALSMRSEHHARLSKIDYVKSVVSNDAFARRVLLLRISVKNSCGRLAMPKKGPGGPKKSTAKRAKSTFDVAVLESQLEDYNKDRLLHVVDRVCSMSMSEQAGLEASARALLNNAYQAELPDRKPLAVLTRRLHDRLPRCRPPSFSAALTPTKIYHVHHNKYDGLVLSLSASREQDPCADLILLSGPTRSVRARGTRCQHAEAASSSGLGM